jgi:predicted DNA-binding transcriptional regulator AlpA
VSEKLLTAREVGEFLACRPRASWRRYRKGENPGFRLASNVLRFDPVEIHAWLTTCRERAYDATRRA